MVHQSIKHGNPKKIGQKSSQACGQKTTTISQSVQYITMLYTYIHSTFRYIELVLLCSGGGAPIRWSLQKGYIKPVVNGINYQAQLVTTRLKRRYGIGSLSLWLHLSAHTQVKSMLLLTGPVAETRSPANLCSKNWLVWSLLPGRFLTISTLRKVASQFLMVGSK